MKIEPMTFKEYRDYIERLKKIPVLEMDYEQLSDLANEQMAVACKEQSWSGVRAAFTMMLLAMNANAGGIHAAKQSFLEIKRQLIHNKEA